MYTKITKWVSMVVLLLAITFWSSAAKYQLELNLVVCCAAVVVFVQAVQTRRYRWAAGFVAIALLFNPAVPVFGLSGMVGLTLVVLSIALFAISLAALKPQTLLSMHSITDRTPGSESL